MKIRILKETMTYGNKVTYRYYPQFKFLWFYMHYSARYCMDDDYMCFISLSEALNYVYQQYLLKEEVNKDKHERKHTKYTTEVLYNFSCIEDVRNAMKVIEDANKETKT